MKINLKHLALFVLAGITLNSCSDDDNDLVFEDAPVISNFELGMGSTHGDGHVAYAGSDIHLEADIIAEAGVQSITVDIHAHDLDVGDGEEEWDFAQIWDDMEYQSINPTFHEHIDVPSNVPAGEYHVILTVTDENGNSTEVVGHIDIMKPIMVSNLSIDESVMRGDDFHVEFMIEAVHGIHHVIVDVHAHGLAVGEGEVEWDFDEEFEDGLHEETEAEFHEHIDVPATAPVGEYHMLITVEDEEGNTHVIDRHIDVTAS
ncbi:DUF4625 domain-containing protein [Maribacter cobaltidurans]|uniref:Protein containing PKD domain-containing protein n=1 Tax=Maribacter cobaltidurans TaxID=1178778 RepID=A0A223V601_9FLAO|nr:DUF4625 domain-containing protein [Maribacter cobaltidurans]ASV30746.1 protein containing PKD domain-containing protein [Maribacter cobaltidurans]GGD81450.1 hypothetical protein GCM10011412_18960 [Maribacter cobaltidurans]